MKRKLVLFLTIILACVLTFSSCGLITRIIDSISGEKGTEGLEYTLLEDGTYSVSVGSATEESEIVIPAEYEGIPVTHIVDEAFHECKSLTSITIPDSITNIGARAFLYCTSLTSITISDNVTNIGYSAFVCCANLKSINVDENNPNYKSIDGNLYTKDGKTLLQYAIGKQNTSFVIPDSVTSIVDWAFCECTSLTSVTIPDSVTSLGFGAFFDCTNLTIYCEAQSKPDGWNMDQSNCPVVWDCTNK